MNFYVKRNAGVITGVSHTKQSWPVEILPDDNAEVIAFLNPDEAKTVEMISVKINDAMYERIATGIKWSLTDVSTVYDIPLTDNNERFLSRNLMKLNEGRTDPHKGYLFTGVDKFSIDDVGLRKLAVFAGEWGDEISRVRLEEIETLGTMTQLQLDAYDPTAIDWSIDWSSDPQNDGEGWSDDHCVQNP